MGGPYLPFNSEDFTMYSTNYICQDLAERMRRTFEVTSFMHESVQKGAFLSDSWMEGTLAEGIPGIVTFYAVLDHHFKNEGWDDVGYNWLKLAMQNLEKDGYNNISLLSGLAGLCFATHLSSKNGTRYTDVLEQLETRLIDEIEHTWSRPLTRSLERGEWLLPAFYNLMQGIAGVIGYLLLRKDDARINRTLHFCVEELSQAILTPVRYKQEVQPSWFVAPNGAHDEGSYILSMPYGITGSLSALSLAARDGIETRNSKKAISHLADWLSKKHSLLQWPPIIPAGKDDVSIGLNKDTWAYGAPPIARSLYLAAQVTNNEELKEFAIDAFMNVFRRSDYDWNQMASTFAAGKAGLLAITHFMRKEIREESLRDKLCFLEERIKSFYSPTHHFGFRTVDVTQRGEYRWIDHPGLLEGASGVALSLLLVQDAPTLPWERAFLIN